MHLLILVLLSSAFQVYWTFASPISMYYRDLEKAVKIYKSRADFTADDKKYSEEIKALANQAKPSLQNMIALSNTINDTNFVFCEGSVNALKLNNDRVEFHKELVALPKFWYDNVKSPFEKAKLQLKKTTYAAIELINVAHNSRVNESLTYEQLMEYANNVKVTSSKLFSLVDDLNKHLFEFRIQLTSVAILKANSLSSKLELLAADERKQILEKGDNICGKFKFPSEPDSAYDKASGYYNRIKDDHPNNAAATLAYVFNFEELRECLGNGTVTYNAKQAKLDADPNRVYKFRKPEIERSKIIHKGICEELKQAIDDLTEIQSFAQDTEFVLEALKESLSTLEETKFSSFTKELFQSTNIHEAVYELTRLHQMHEINYAALLDG